MNIRIRRKKRIRNFFLFFSLSLFVLLEIYALHVRRDEPQEIISPQAPTPTYAPLVSFLSLPTPSPEVSHLTEAIDAALEGTQGTYGVVVKNLKTNEQYMRNEHHSFQTGSLYKLWVMDVVYEQIRNGILHEDDMMTQDVAKLNEEFQISPEYAEQTEGTIHLTVSDALNLMITVSDNYSALLLTEKIGLSSLATFLKSRGFSESKVGTDGNPPVSTAYDIATFLGALYRHELVNDEYSDKMMGLLKAQKLNDKLPKYLPDDIQVAHKTGELDAFSHDAGIVYTPDGDYIIVILSESDNPPLAEERIAGVSQAVYQYFAQ